MKAGFLILILLIAAGCRTPNVDKNESKFTDQYVVIDISGGINAITYPVTELGILPSPIPKMFKTTKIVLRRIPKGTFIMGSPSEELGRYRNETQHQVTLTEDFYIGIFEVTQKQYNLVVGTWPSHFNDANYRDILPVESVSYSDIRGSSAGARWPKKSAVDAMSFLGKLQARTGLALDLPTEAQWEYACRAGTATALNSGVNLANVTKDSSMDVVGRYSHNRGSGYSIGSGLVAGEFTRGAAAVGSYTANDWGLYDMHGNVWEWCLDWHTSNLGSDAVSDPRGPSSNFDPDRPERTLRGGSSSSYAGDCRSAYRRGDWGRINDTGFRLASPRLARKKTRAMKRNGSNKSVPCCRSQKTNQYHVAKQIGTMLQIQMQ